MKKLLLIILISIISTSANAQWKAYGPTSQVDGIIKYKDKIFAGSFQNTFFSDNNAESWAGTKKDFSGASSFKCFAYSDKYIYAGFESSIFRSSDEGVNWEEISPGNYIGAVCMLAYNDSLIFVSNLGRIYKSSENKIDFKDISGYFGTHNLIAGKKDTLFLGGYYKGLFVSVDGGRHLNDISKGLDTNLIFDLKLRNNDIYIITAGSCYKSSDNGKSWIKQFDSLNTTSRIYSFYFDKDRIIVYTKEGLKYSDDEGTTWIDANFGLPKSSVSGLISKAGYYFLSNKLGVYRCEKDKFIWSQMNKNLSNSFVMNVAQSGDCLAAQTGGFGPEGIYTSKNRSVSWVMQNPDSFSIAKSFTFAPGKIISFTSKNVKYSSDNGKTWVDKSAGLGKVIILSSACILRDTIYIYAGGNSIYKADTVSLNWTKIKMNLPFQGINSIFAFQGNLYASHDYNGIFKAYDDNTNWQVITNFGDGFNFATTKVKGDTVFSYMIDPNNDTHFIFSKDFINWYQIPLETPPNGYFDFVFHQGEIFTLISGKGVLKSSDNGETWIDFNNGLNNYEVVNFAQDSTHLYVATLGGGVNVFDFTDLYTSPSLIAPSDKAIKNPASITFNWSHSNEISKDLFELALDADFKSITNSSEINTGDITITNLISDTLYYWRVKSIFPNGDSKVSETWTLSTKYASNVGLLPGDLLSVAPNPPNDNIYINYKFEKAEKVNIYIVDVLGNKLYEAKGLRKEEHYSINVSQFTAGIYYLVFDTGLSQIKEKIVIAK